jgi:hypothetical protein
MKRVLRTESLTLVPHAVQTTRENCHVRMAGNEPVILLPAYRWRETCGRATGEEKTLFQNI